MYKIKIYKLIDLRVQASLIVACTVYTFINISFLFYAYFIVGGWLLLSCMVHGLFFPAGRSRSLYLRVLLWLSIGGILAIPAWPVYGFILLFVSPFLAIWYGVICYRENRFLNHRMLVHLK